MREATQKNPSVATRRSEPKAVANLLSTGSRKHAVHQPAHDPFPRVASRGQVLEVTSSIRLLYCTALATSFPCVFNVLRGFSGAPGCPDCVSVTQLQVVGYRFFVIG